MKTRVISGIILVIIAVAFLLLGGWWLYGLTLCISLVGMFELYRVVGIHNNLLGIVGYCTTFFYYFGISLFSDKIVFFIILTGFLVTMAIFVFSFPKFKAIDAVWSFIGVFYVAVMLSYIYQVRQLQDGIFIVWLIFIASWVNDTFAYFSGVAFGKHKMAPILSPKKSIEGGVGGVLASIIVGALYGFIIKGYVSTVFEYPMITFAIAGGVGALFAIVGDLTASAIKRNYEIKDYSNLIPGHGGIMDRFDSVIFTAPIVYMATVLLNGGLG